MGIGLGIAMIGVANTAAVVSCRRHVRVTYSERRRRRRWLVRDRTSLTAEMLCWSLMLTIGATLSLGVVS